MGNCLFGGMGEGDGVIKVITSNGGIMEFKEHVTAGSITEEFPGHAIFRSRDLFWKPLFRHEELHPGKSYYLLPLNDVDVDGAGATTSAHIVRQGHVRSNSIPAASLVASYRMSFDYHGSSLKRSYTDVFSRYSNKHNKNGRCGGGINTAAFWKVKLVISPEQLLEILSQEGRTQELIENVRTVAKCVNGGGGSSSSSSVGFSDQWSLSSSRNASSKKDDLLLEF